MTEFKKTLPQVIESHLLSLQHDTGISSQLFAVNVREHYEDNFPAHIRHIEFSSHSDLSIRMIRDAERLKTWIGADAKVRFPLEIIESVVAAFPEDRRFKLQMELSLRQNMIAVPMPNASGSSVEDGALLGKIAKETGEVIISISTLLQDGSISEKDHREAPETIKEIDEAIAVLLSMKAHIEVKALGKKEPLKIAS